MQITLNNVEWTWFIRRVSIKKSLDNFSNIITSVSWSLKAEYIDPESKEHYVEDYSHTTELNSPDETNFIEYEYIDDSIVISWVKNVEPLTYIEEKIISKLNDQCDEEISTTLNNNTNNQN